jgi:hypothetical protein
MTFNEEAFDAIMLNVFKVVIPLLLVAVIWTVVSYHKLAKEAEPYLKKGKQRE